MYTSYGSYPYPQSNQPAQPNASQDTLDSYFNAVDSDRSGKISANELRTVLINGQNESFSEVCCQLLISLFDVEKNGTVDKTGFRHLYKYVNDWLNVFKLYDKDNSKTIDQAELSEAFKQMGYRFSDAFITFLVEKNDLKSHKRVTVDQFIILCIRIQKLTESFRSKDSQRSGSITVAFEDFLGMALSAT